MSSETIDLSQETKWIVSRPQEIVQNLRIEDRWEVTRRHPYYLLFWEEARAHVEDSDEVGKTIQFAARLMLQQINFSSVYPPPGTSAEELGAHEVESPWNEGAIARASVRTVVATMIIALPVETKQVVVDLLQRSLNLTTQQDQYDLIQDLTQGEHPNFDDHFPDLLITINPHASQRAAAKAVEQVVQQYRKQHDIPEHRRQEKKLGEYLEVWDLREGWTGEGYDCSKEMKLKEIAGQLNSPVQTIANRYASAFRLIVGHEYSAELWARVMGIPKLAGLMGGGHPRLSAIRPMHKRRPREVPETTLGKHSSEPTERDFLRSAGFEDVQLDQIYLCQDVVSLISEGKSNEEIIKEMEITNGCAAHELIDYFREGGTYVP